MAAIQFAARILRKQPDLPRYIVVPGELVTDRTGSFAARVSLNGSVPFERTIRPWGKGADVYFFNLAQLHCRAAAADTGDRCEVRIEPL